MAENYRENFSLYIKVERQSVAFERWFRIASRNLVYFGADDDTFRYDLNSYEAEQYFALHWQQFEAAVVADQPNNKLTHQTLIISDERVRAAFNCDTMPSEFLEE